MGKLSGCGQDPSGLDSCGLGWIQSETGLWRRGLRLFDTGQGAAERNWVFKYGWIHVAQGNVRSLTGFFWLSAWRSSGSVVNLCHSVQTSQELCPISRSVMCAW